MTREDRLRLLREKCAELGQARVASLIGYSKSAVNLALNGHYKGDLTSVLRRVEEVFGGHEVDCPLLGTIPLKDCAEYRRRKFALTNPMRARLWKECRRCPVARQHQ